MMASRNLVQCLVVLSMVALLGALTVTDNQGRQFEQKEIVVPTGISDAELNVEIQKAIRELYPTYKNKPNLVVKELASFDDLNGKVSPRPRSLEPVAAAAKPQKKD